MTSQPIISSDSHVFEPPDLWTDRVDAKYRDRAPHLVKEETGDRFHCDNSSPRASLGNLRSVGGESFD